MHAIQLKDVTGMVIPVWYPATVSAGEMEALLTPCLTDAGLLVRPEHMMVVVDGAAHVVSVVEQLRRHCGPFQIITGEQNEGKGGAVALGLQRLMALPAVQWMIIRDHDNDHLANDAVNLARLAAHIQARAQMDHVVVVGRRHSIHRSLGFVRGEYETFMNEVILDAVRYAAARANLALNTQYFAAYDFVPDMQSGFKCYTRATAQLYLDTLEQAARQWPDLDVRRHGAEVPILVETWLRGGVVGEINRAAFEHQPFTTYDLPGRFQVKGTVLAWTFLRAGVPSALARQYFLNAAARRTLSKDEKGRVELLALSNWVLKKLAEDRRETVVKIDGINMSDYF